MGAILNSAILNSGHLGFCHHSFSSQTRSHLQRLVPTICTKKISLPHPSPPFAQKNFTHSFCTQLDDGSHLEFCHLEFGHLGFSCLSFSSETHSHLPRLVPTICTKKKPSLVHSDSTWWWQPSWILLCWIQTPSYFLSDLLKKILSLHSDSYLDYFNLTQTHSFSLNLMMAAILNSAILNLAILDSAILVFPLKLTDTCQDWFPPFAQKKPSLIQSDSTWWWQPSWILPSWIQTLPSWIQTPSYLLSDSLKNTLPLLWLLTQTNSIWLKLIHSDSTWWWQPSWILPSWIWPSWIQPP